MNLKRAFPLVLMSLLAGAANAQISVNRSVIEFTDQQRIQDIEVLNTGRGKVYLDLSVAEIVDPEADEPRRVEFDDPRSAPVLVSPRQLLVPPRTRKRVRVIMREGAPRSDRIFRLAITPYTGKARIMPKEGVEKTSAVRVLVAYDLLLIARPSELRPAVAVKRDDKSIVFRNEGNTNVLLRRIVQCEGGVDPDAPQADKSCVEIPANRLYAGETYRVSLPKKGSAARYPVKVWESVGFTNTTRSF